MRPTEMDGGTKPTMSFVNASMEAATLVSARISLMMTIEMMPITMPPMNSPQFTTSFHLRAPRVLREAAPVTIHTRAGISGLLENYSCITPCSWQGLRGARHSVARLGEPGALHVTVPPIVANRLRRVYREAGFTTPSSAAITALRDWIERRELHLRPERRGDLRHDEVVKLAVSIAEEILRRRREGPAKPGQK